MNFGIYTLANDVVYDQLVALLNSIERNCGAGVPVCIIPYDDQLDLIKAEIGRRRQVSLFDNTESIARWDNFVHQFHQLYLNYPHPGIQHKRHLCLNIHRKYAAFDGELSPFLFIDVDTLLFQPLDHVFAALNTHDFVVHDFQRLTCRRRQVPAGYLQVFPDAYPSQAELEKRFHCSGFWASKSGVISPDDLPEFIQALGAGDMRALNYEWLGEQSILNYMTFKKNLRLYNFTFDETSPHYTGVCITSDHFVEQDHILYDHGKKLTYLHYMGIQNHWLHKLCAWKKLGLPLNPLFLKLADKLFKWQLSKIPYKEIFLYYRFL